MKNSFFFSSEMASICVLLLLFLSQTGAKEGALDMKQEVGPENNKINVTVDLWAEMKELRDLVIEQNIELGRLQEENAELLSKVTANENKVTVLDARVSELKAEAEELKRQITESPKVAFSLALTDAGTIGPFTTDITLKFSKVLTNFGQAYNTYTGIFTAPFRGVYYFGVTVFVAQNHQSLGAALYHNDKRVGRLLNLNDTRWVSGSNGYVLELEKGDVVYLVLPSGYGVYDNVENYTVFSGFLIFPL